MGLSCPDPELARTIRNPDAMAIAGVRPRPYGPDRFYLSTDPEAFRTGLEGALLPLASQVRDQPAWRLPPAAPVPDRSSRHLPSTTTAPDRSAAPSP